MLVEDRRGHGLSRGVPGLLASRPIVASPVSARGADAGHGKSREARLVAEAASRHRAQPIGPVERLEHLSTSGRGTQPTVAQDRDRRVDIRSVNRSGDGASLHLCLQRGGRVVFPPATAFHPPTRRCLARGRSVDYWVAVSTVAALAGLVIAVSARATQSDPPRGAPAASRLSDERTLSRWARPAQLSTIRRLPDRRSTLVGRLHWLTEDGRPEVYLALQERQDATGRSWAQVRVPGRPNNLVGWVPRSSLGPWPEVATQVEIDRSARRLRLRRDGQVVLSVPVGIGAVGTPTPAGRFVVRERLSNAGGDPLYGRWAIGTSAYSALSDWPRGGVVGIHGTNQPWLIPGRPSHGCVRLENPAMAALVRLLPIGTPIWIH